MSARAYFAQYGLLLILVGSMVFSVEASHAQSLDTCELDLDLSADIDDCEAEEVRSAGWMRLGYPPAGSGLLQAGNLVGQVVLTPGTANEIRVAQILPTQASVWVSLQDARATLIPGEWIDVVLVRQSIANAYALSVVHWQSAGLSVTGTVLATSSSFTQANEVALNLGWSFGQGQVTVNVSGPGSTTLAVSRTGFGGTLPWLSLPHFPGGQVDLGTANVVSLSGSAQ
jgi:hypothetical protein